MPAEAFRVRTENARTGRTTLPEFQPVKDGETILFVSDPDGSPEDVVVRYSLNMPSGAPAGQYSTEISYSITTL